jgi:NADPH2:quinone reductase
MTCTMRAYVTGEATPLTLTDRPLPALGREEVLVRTRAAALNNSDLTPSGDDHIVGFEFAGDVIEVGADAPAQLRGVRVMGIAAGALAEVVVAHHRHVVAVPEALSYDEASALPTALATEHGALTLGSVGPATSVLITAATSGIGIMGVQIAKFLGAPTVVATTRSPHKRRLLEQAGADAVVITSADEDLVAGTRRVTGGNGARVVLDHVGGDRLADAVEAACDGGDVISVGRLGGARGSLDLFTLARRHVTLRSVSYGLTPPAVLGDLFDSLATEVLPAVAEGRIRALIDRAYAFRDAHTALERLASGEAGGKVVLQLD